MLQHRGCSNALAALAAGGMLALSPAAEAKIVYTPAHIPIYGCGRPASCVGLVMDLNKDGIADFNITLSTQAAGSSYNQYLRAFPQVEGNGAMGYGIIFASALRAGARIGPKANFYTRAYGLEMAGMQCYHGCAFAGAWANQGNGVKHRFLGLKFRDAKGKTHYGWARFKVTFDHGVWMYATMLGYAYETVPTRGITAGKTKGPDVIRRQPASLGHLALGASALSTWRGSEDVAVH